jgi:hypothetical protein
MVGADEILKNADQNAVFMPILGGLLKSVLPSAVDTSDSPSKLIQEAIDNIKANQYSMRNNSSILEQLKTLNLDADISQEELIEMEYLLNKNQDSLKDSNKEFKSKILELLDKEDK